MRTENPSILSPDLAISVKHLTKIYPLFASNRDRFKEVFHPLRKKYHHDFYALQDVTFDIARGETIGIIGQNGSGKSTLLKILSRVLTPSSGHCEVNGRVSSLLELGTGFNPELSGIENVYFNGTILGFTRSEMDAKLDDILGFADIGEFVHQPVKMYSSGMYVRLAFAVAVQVDPDILIVDEALAVGDARFQVKSMNRMLRFVESGKTILFVSHDTAAIKTLCKRALLLDKGKLLMDDVASKSVDYYNNMVLNDLHKGAENLLNPLSLNKVEGTDQTDIVIIENERVKLGENSINTGNVELLAVHIYNSKGNRVESVTSEEDVKIVFKIKALTDIEDPHYGIGIANRLGVAAFETNTFYMKHKTNDLKRDDEVVVEYLFNCNLYPDLYSISVGLASKGFNRWNFEKYFFNGKDVAILRILENPKSILYGGYCNVNPIVKITKI